MSVFEALMLVAFSVGWPVSIFKSLRADSVQGKSSVFLAIILAGYLFGIAHKLVCSLDAVIAIYVLNAAMVLADLIIVVAKTARLKARSSN